MTGAVDPARGRAPRPAEHEPVDVAVVGAGVAGLYAAWSLRTREPGPRALFGGPQRPSVAVFEMGDRVGGRLLSVAPPDAPHLRAELGGMRFLPGRQPLVSGLIERFGLAIRPQQLADEHSLVYTRGVRRRLPELSDAGAALPYDLAPSERGCSPIELIGASIVRHIPEALELDRRGWTALKQTREVAGRPLTDLSLHDLMRDTLSPEAIELAAVASGYDTFLRAYNAADVLQVLVSLASPEFHTPVDGYDALPRALARALTEAGGELALGHRLLTVERVAGDDGQPRLRCVLDRRGQLVTVVAGAVVLALPAAGLAQLDQTGFLFDDREVRADLTSVAPVPASKLFLAYDDAWWTRLGSSIGHLATDLPLRQAMYFGIEGEAGGCDGDGHALLMASYNQSLSTWYWADAFVGDEPFPSRGDVPSGLQAPATMVAAAQAQLCEAYGFVIPEPYWAVYKDWAVEPFNGGWSQWRVGARSYEVMPRVRHPASDAHLYICGDTYSDLQGWVEGALSTTERVLQDHFGLAWPSDRLAAGSELGA